MIRTLRKSLQGVQMQPIMNRHHSNADTIHKDCVSLSQIVKSSGVKLLSWSHTSYRAIEEKTSLFMALRCKHPCTGEQ